MMVRVRYRISGNYSFCKLDCGKYSREETNNFLPKKHQWFITNILWVQSEGFKSSKKVRKTHNHNCTFGLKCAFLLTYLY